MHDFMMCLGARLVDIGVSIVPIAPRKKFPAVFEFQNWRPMFGWNQYADRLPTELELFHWSQWPGAGIGVVCGKLAAVDIDFLDPEKAWAIDMLARESLGDTPALRIGRAPKRLLVYRSDHPINSISIGPLELLGRGRQFVAYGIHPGTGRPYDWPKEGFADIRLSDLPVLSAERVDAFISQVRERFSNDVKPPMRSSATRQGTGLAEGGEMILCMHSSPQPRANEDAIKAALAFIPNNDLAYHAWVRVGLALKGALGDRGWLVFAEWSHCSSKDNPAFTAKTWRSLKPTRIGPGTIFYMAKKAGWSPAPELRFQRKPEDPHPARKFFKEY